MRDNNWNDTEDITWIRSSFCAADKPQCVEVRINSADEVEVRDSKAPERGSLVFTAAEWDAFLNGVVDGEFDQGALREQAGLVPA